MDGRAVRRVDAAEDSGGADELGGLLRLAPTQVGVPDAEGASLVDLGPAGRGLRRRAGEADRAALPVVAVDALGTGDGAHLVDRMLHGASHGVHGFEPGLLGQGCVGDGEEGGAPAPVSPRRSGAGHVLLDHGHPQVRVRPREVVRRPKARKTTADDGHVDIEVVTERGTRDDRARERVEPEGQASPA